MFYTLLSAFSFLLLLTLGVRVLQDRGGKLSTLFGLYALAASGVSLIELMVRLSESGARAAFWGSAAFLWPLVPVLFLHFALLATISAGPKRQALVLLDYAGGFVVAALYYRHFQSGHALVWRYGWSLTSPLSTEWPWILFSILATSYVVAPMLLFLFRVIRPGGVLSRREQWWLLIGYGLRFVIVGTMPVVAGLFGVLLPELNSAAYAVFAIFIYIGISRSYFLSLTPRRSIGSILSTMEEFLFLTTPRLTVVFANGAACTLLGADSGTIHGKSLPKLLGLAEEEELPQEVRYEDSEGACRDLQLLSTRVDSPSGAAVGYVFLGRDVTDDRRREAVLQETVLIKESVLRELQHRVYNTLQTVTSLLHLKAGSTRTAEASQVLAQSAGRVERMAQVYRLAHESNNFSRVPFDSLLNGLTMDSYQARPDGCRVELSVTAEPVALDISLAVPLLLIAGELVDNALLHAFPQGGVGGIHVGFLFESPSVWALSVSDNGGGLSETSRDRGGLLVVEALAEQIGAEMEIQVDGGTTIAIRSGSPGTATGQAFGSAEGSDK